MLHFLQLQLNFMIFSNLYKFSLVRGRKYPYMKIKMKKTYSIFLILIFFGCKKDEEKIEIPLSPTNLSAQLITGTQVNLTWTDNSTNESGFKIDRKQTGGQYSNIATLNSDVTLYSDNGLTINETYTYRLYSFNTRGNSITYSNEVTITTKAPPVLNTEAIASVTTTSGISGGKITNDGGSTVSARGICWSTSANPTISLSTKTSNGTGSGSFSSVISNLMPSTKYYVRAYATNNSGTGYGNEVSFTTLEASSPTLTTTNITSISYRNSLSGGQVLTDGNAPILERGVVWGTMAGPTVETNTGKSNNGTGIGGFASSLINLQPGTTYYVRAYARNAGVIGYGDEKIFQTLPLVVPVLTTIEISEITSKNAKGGGTILNDGGSTISAKGVCWSTSPNPTTNLSTKTSDGPGMSAFSSILTNLNLHTTYYVRSYATNATGTAYGNQIVFTTKYGIGETGPSGGLIFYDKGISSNGWRYLEAAPSDYFGPVSTVWWNGSWIYQDAIGISPYKDLGTGKTNTSLIIAANSNLNNAAKICDDYIYNGFSDWYLPSIDELQLICKNLHSLGIGNFSGDFYWSSTDTYRLHNAWWMQFSGGCQLRTDFGRNMTNKIRPVRQF